MDTQGLRWLTFHLGDFDMGDQPSANGQPTEGRNGKGQFEKGNKFGRGSPWIAQVSKHRQALFDAAKDDDAAHALATYREIMLDKCARASDRLRAAELLLARLIGEPARMLVLTSEEELHDLLAEIEAGQPTVGDEIARIIGDGEGGG